MNRIIATAASLCLGYLVGLWLSDGLFSADIMETDWTNIWVYAYILFWPVAIILKIWVWIIIIALASFFSFCLWEAYIFWANRRYLKRMRESRK